MSWNGSLWPPRSRLEHLLKKCIPPLCFSVIRRRRDYICMMRLQKKELDIRGTEHLKTHRGSDTTNSELYTADILRNALNVKSRQLSTGRSIDEMAGEDADTWRGVDTGRVTQENGLFRRDAGRPTHIKRACGIASQTLHLYMYDAILRRRLTSRRRCRSDRPCCRCSGPDSRRWYSAPPPWARPRPRSRSGALPWCHRRT